MTNISFKKLVSLFEKHKFILLKNYICGEVIRLIELKSPKYQKIFFVYIPSRYVLYSIDEYPNEHISKIEIPQKYNEYFHLINFTNICIIGKQLCCSIDNNIECFNFKNESIVEEDPQQSLINQLEEKFKNLKADTQMNKNYDFELVTSGKNIEFIFYDSQENEIEKNSNMEKILIDSETPKKIYIDKYTTAIFDPQTSNHTSFCPSPNYSDIEEDNILINDKPTNINKFNIGDVYICITLNEFSNSIDIFEDELMEKYKNFEIREKEIKKDVMKDIIFYFESLKTKTQERLEQISQEEEDIDKKIRKLSNLLIQCDRLGKFNKNKEEIDNLYEKTKHTFDELYTQKLNLRDESFKLVRKFNDFVDKL